MTEILETKEVSVVKQQATKALSAANEIVIKSQEDMVKATDVLSKIKSVGKLVKERKELITRPLMESLNSVRDLFKPIEQTHADAERIIKGKMLDWQNAEEARQEKERLAIANRVEKGTMKPETAVAKMEKIAPVQTSAQGKVGTVTTRIVKKYRVTDESKLPREFLVPDMGKISEALKAGQVVPGAEIYEEKVISAR
jgi:hypothetical protein